MDGPYASPVPYALLASLAVLAAVLVGVVRADGRRSELWWSGPAAVLVLALGLVDVDTAAETVRDLAPTLVFLAAMFVVAAVADAAGLFTLAARTLGRAGRRGETPQLVAVAVAAVAVTTVLSLDATAVLLTPVVIATTRGRTGRDRSLLATVFLANGASLLLPVANLTNLLALDQLGLSFPAFAARMALPTLAAATVITIGCRYLTPDRPAARPTPDRPAIAADGVDRVAASMVGAALAVLLVAFVAASVVGVDPAPVAVVGALVVAAIGVGRGQVAGAALARSVDVRFLAFVAALGVVVAAPAEQGLTRFVADRLPDGTGLVSLLVVAFGAALLANLVTNLPATLVLLPALAGRPTALLLAALIGVNVGPNLTVTGSLATLLWRRVVRRADAEPPLASFTRVTLATTPIAVAAATTALWWSLRLVG